MKIMGEQPKNAATGYKKEKAVANWLKRHGFEILYEGGRGPADIIARNRSRKWAIQVKYTRSYDIDSTRFWEKDALIKLAKKEKGTAVLCSVVRTSVWFRSAKTYETLVRAFYEI